MKPNKKQQEVIKVLKSFVDQLENTNDINSPTIQSDTIENFRNIPHHGIPYSSYKDTIETAVIDILYHLQDMR